MQLSLCHQSALNMYRNAYLSVFAERLISVCDPFSFITAIWHAQACHFVPGLMGTDNRSRLHSANDIAPALRVCLLIRDN